MTKLLRGAVPDPARTVAMMCGPEVMMRFTAEALLARGVPPEAIWWSMERSMACGEGHCGHCQLGPLFVCKDGPVLRHDVVEPLLRVARAVSDRPTLAVWKFASCDGCQLSLLDCEDELLELAARIDLASFPEAGPTRLLERYDLSIVEGSITTPDDAERIRDVRARSRRLITIGACANAGGIQALRNFADVDGLRARSSTPTPPTSARCATRPRSAPTSRSTSSCRAARPTSASSSRSSRPSSTTAAPRSPRTASASSASAAATSASWSPTARRAWAR